MGNSVIESAQEKTNSGTISYSIIKSLNVFNSITRDDTKKINDKLLNTNTWFQDLETKMTTLKNTTMLLSPEETKPVSKILQQEVKKEKGDIIDDVPRLSSPEQVQSLKLNNNTDSIVLDSESTGKQDLFITANPSPIMQRTPKNTEAINIHGHTIESTVPKFDKTETVIAKTIDEGRPSPWSPFKVENTLKNVNISIDEKNQSILSNHSISLTDPHVGIENKSEIKQDISISESKSVLKGVDDKPVSNLVVLSQNDIKDKISNIGLSVGDNKSVSNISPIPHSDSINKATTFRSPVSKTSVTSPKIISKEPAKPNIRVNMFAPLPEKDPLIVRNSSPQSSTTRSNNNTLKFQKGTPTSNLSSTRHNNPLLTSKPPLSKSSTSPSSSLRSRTVTTPRSKTHIIANPYNKNERRNIISPKKSSKNVSPLKRSTETKIVNTVDVRNLKSPVSKPSSKTPSRTSSNNTKSGGVFDRLSSLPTKSFEQKIRHRTGTTPIAPRRHNPSSIDVTGSPLKRISPQHKKANQSEILEQEALSSIFFKNKSQETRSLLRKERVSPIEETGPLGSKLNSNQVYDSLIPKLEQQTSVNEFKSQPQVEQLSVKPPKTTNKISSPIKIETMTNESLNSRITNTLVDMNIMSPAKRAENISPKLQKTSITTNAVEINKLAPGTHISLSSLNPNERISPTKIKPRQHHDDQKLTSSNILLEATDKDKMKSIPIKETQLKDTTTKIQLIPSTDHGKDDVKTKLNKRLSQVIRTQQEQEKKRKENQQKRKKSQLEDELKRKKSRYSNYKMYSKKRSLGTNTDHLSKSGYYNTTANGLKSNVTNIIQANDSIIDTSNILGDIDKVDYRNIIGGENTPDMNKIVPPLGSNSVGNDSLPEIASEDELDRDVMADWAQASALENQLKIQQNWDPKKIFGPIAPLHIDEIFPNSSASRLSKVKAKFTKKSTWKS